MKVSDIARKMIFSIIIVSVVFILASAIYYRSLEFLPFLWGVCLGTLVSIARVLLLERTVDKALQMESNKAKNHVGIQHLLRLLLIALVLVLGAFVEQISFWGVAAGVLTFQFSLYLVKITDKTNKEDKDKVK